MDNRKMENLNREQTEARDILFSSKENVLTILENTLDSIWAINTSYEILYANKAFVSAFFNSFGVRLKPNVNLLLSLPELYRDVWKSYYDRALKNEMFSFIDKIDLETTSLYIEVSINPIVVKGKVTGASFFGKDITERYETERALKKSQILLKSSLESQNSTVLFSIDKNYQYLYFNRAHYDGMKHAYNKDIKVGMNILECITSDDDRAVAKENYDRALRGESHTNVREFGKDNVAYFESFFNPILNDKSEIIGATGLARDITERKKSEQAIKVSKSALLEAQQIAQVGNWELDIVNNTLKWSDEIYRMFDCEPSYFKATYEAFIEFVYPDDREKVSIAYTNSLKSRTPYEIEHRILTKSKTVKYVKEKCRTDYDENGNPLKSFGIVMDITKQKESEKALKESEAQLLELNASKDKLFSIIAHDLKAPFNSILGFSNLLIDNMKNFKVEESERFLKIINSSAASTLILLDNLLNWAKLQTGQLRFNPEKRTLSEVIQEILVLKSPLAKAKNVSLHSSQSDEFDIYVDQNILGTVLRNLVSNAIKFTKPGGRVIVSAISRQNQVEISVSDNGIGMNDNILEQLFDLSTNSSSLGTENEKGSGLGLILCKEFVEKLGGNIWVESEEGKGSDFRFTVPLNKS